MNRKRVVLATLLGVLAVCMIYAYMASPRLEKAPPRTTVKKSSDIHPSFKAAKVDKSGRIDFSYMTVTSETFPGAKRNIFGFGPQGSSESITSTPVATPDIPEPVEVIEEIQVAPTITPLEIVQRSLGQFAFLGFLDKGGEKTVFLSSGGELFLVKQGEVFGTDREFTVNAIDGNILKVKHSGSAGLIEVQLIEQKKLSAAVSAPARFPASPEQVPAIKNRIFRPQKNVRVQPVVPEENEKTFRELIEEYKPEEQEQVPADGDKVEGEVNGANQ